MELIVELAEIVTGQRNRTDQLVFLLNINWCSFSSIDQMITVRFLLLSGSPTFGPSQEETLPRTLHLEGHVLAFLLRRRTQGQGDMPTWNPCLPSRHFSMEPWNSLHKCPLDHFQVLHRVLFQDCPPKFWLGHKYAYHFPNHWPKGTCIQSTWAELGHGAVVSMYLRVCQLNVSKTRQIWAAKESQNSNAV